MTPSGEAPQLQIAEEPIPVPMDTRRYLPRAFGFLIEVPDRTDGIRAFVEGTLFVASTTDRGNVIDAIGTVTLPYEEPIDFETLNQLAAVTKWPQETIQDLIARFQKLLS